MHKSNFPKTNKVTVTKFRKEGGKSKKTSKKSAKTSNTKKGTSFISFLFGRRMVQVYGVLLMSFALLLLVSMVSAYFHFQAESSTVESGTQSINVVGTVGSHLAYYLISNSFGFFSLGFVLLFFIYGFKMTFERSILPPLLTTLTTIISMAWISTVSGCFMDPNKFDFISGKFGNFSANYLLTHTHNWGTALILIGAFLIILILFYNISPKKMIEVITINGTIFPEKVEKPIKVEKTKQTETKIEQQDDISPMPIPIQITTHKDDKVQQSELYIENLYGLTKEYESEGVNLTNENLLDKSKKTEKIEQKVDFQILSAPIEGLQEIPDFFEELNKKSDYMIEEDDDFLIDDENDQISGNQKSKIKNQEIQPPLPLEDYDPRLDLSFYKFPDSNLLFEYEVKEVDKETILSELKENAEKIQFTLKNFGIPIKDIKVTMGPTVTLYEIVPEDGIRISKIRSLENDIALNLAALGIRIIAPIPGRGTIGIEVPNKNAQIVSMKEIINSDKFQHNKYDLPIGLGKTISNEPFVVDLAKMPHLLMAGATGQGKSVGLNAIITSLLYKKHPSEIKFVLIDPKKVEFTLYNIIEKHYLAMLPDADDPIITDTKKVIQTLNSLCVEMDNRYDLLKLAKTRNIKEYNHKFCTRKLSPALGHRYLPYIVLIIDEFGDLIMTAGRDIETPIARLAQLARAIGIHLIIATQRPSVNIITGTIKANFPARLAFRVSSKIDSRTILDGNGADQLIGKGDMLLSTGSDLIRLQCAFVDTPEVEKVAQFIEEQQSYPEAFILPEYILEDKGKKSDEDIMNTDEIDPLFLDAATLIVQSQMGSTSLLQRKMKLGYNRAGRIMDQLEEFGIVGPSLGSRAREVKVRCNEELMPILQKMGLF